MIKSLLFSATLAVTALLADATTKVAVIELGKGGSVRRTTSKSTQASAAGVASFWDALHKSGRRELQHAGMTVVPDLFNKVDSSVVIGISGEGVELEKMPSISGLFSEEGPGVVGHFDVVGHKCDDLMARVDGVDVVSSPILSAAKKQAEASGISGMKMVVDSSTVGQVDAEMESVLREIDEMAKAAGTTVVVHLIVETTIDSVSVHRRLEEADGEEENEDGENNNNMYGYGYYENGVYYTPYKTMFQIQYFNVVLWTSLGLLLVAISAIYMMMFMPLEPDTLLFGESAKVVE